MYPTNNDVNATVAASNTYTNTRNKKKKLILKRMRKKPTNTKKKNKSHINIPRPKSKKKKNFHKTKSEKNTIKNENENDNISMLQRTCTSPIYSHNMMAKETETHKNEENEPKSPFEMEVPKSSKTKKKSYFQNYFQTNRNKPKEVNVLLDRIENDLQFIFKNKSVRSNKIYNLCTSLHHHFIEYKLLFLLPVCKIKLFEVDAMLVSVIKSFNKLKRYHRSPQILKYKQQISKIKNNIDILITNIEAHSSIILYALIRAKQLFLQFHKNKNLLIFWMHLFPKNELEFVQLSWFDFVHNIRQNKSFKKFRKFAVEDFERILENNYEVLTIQEFLKYVLEYESVGGWLNDMYSYIAAEIANPHKKNKKNSAENTMSELTDSLQTMIKNTIQTEMSQQFNELSARFGQFEASLAAIKSNQHKNILDEDIMDDDELIDKIASFEKITSNGTVILHQISDDSSNCSSSHSSDNIIIMEQAPDESKNKTVECLQGEISKLRTENFEYNTKLKDYEARLDGVTMQSKQVFSLQTKVNYYEKMARLMKKKCFSLHKQLNQDLSQFGMWYNSTTLENNIDGKQQSKLLQIQSLFDSYLHENGIVDNDKINEIQVLFKDLLAANDKTSDKKSDVMWQRMRSSLQDGTAGILSIHQQLNDNFLSPLSSLPQLSKRSQSENSSDIQSESDSGRKPAQHWKRHTFSVDALKAMNHKMISSHIRIKNRTYSAHDLEQLKFIPLRNNKINIDDNSFDVYTNKIKKGKIKGVFVPSINKENIDANVKDNSSQRSASNSPLLLLSHSAPTVANKKRRNSDSNLAIKHSKDDKLDAIHKLFENESKLNDDTINKIRNELLKENKINKSLQRRHSMCSVTGYTSNINMAKSECDLLTEAPINYNTFSSRSRAISAGNTLNYLKRREPLMGLHGDHEFSDDDLLRMRETHFTHFKNRSLKQGIGSLKIKLRKRKHTRYKTETFAHLNATLLSPNWAANVALNAVSKYDDIGYDATHESGSDVSALSNIDYTFILDEYEDYDTKSQDVKDIDPERDAEQKHYVNIYGSSPQKGRIHSIIDPFDLLDDKMLTELLKNDELQLKKSEIEMKRKLILILREMDLMDEGRLDLADFTSAIMNVVNDYDDIMEDAELLFDELESQQDDMGAVKIKDIVDAIMLNKECEAAENIKKQIMIALKLNDCETDENNEQENEHKHNIEDMPKLYVKPKEIDPNAQPYKPLYQITSCIQKIGDSADD